MYHMIVSVASDGAATFRSYLVELDVNSHMRSGGIPLFLLISSSFLLLSSSSSMMLPSFPMSFWPIFVSFLSTSTFCSLFSMSVSFLDTLILSSLCLSDSSSSLPRRVSMVLIWSKVEPVDLSSDVGIWLSNFDCDFKRLLTLFFFGNFVRIDHFFVVLVVEGLFLHLARTLFKPFTSPVPLSQWNSSVVTYIITATGRSKD